ncbi:hypothetical protein ACHAXA_008829 [Cyclostephanos tholiformis]|uniref:Coenzyme Q-binding protein COQ10 START domain-containing protein n=1 Tax=Cyclostephanos tholiformis TaxID=382380 RepID=A0ABD3RCY8_9STRA
MPTLPSSSSSSSGRSRRVPRRVLHPVVVVVVVSILLLLLAIAEALRSSPPPPSIVASSSSSSCTRDDAVATSSSSSSTTTTTTRIGYVRKSRPGIPIRSSLNCHHDYEEQNDDDDGTDGRLVVCTASIALPFSEELAFDYFSDLTRQPSWCGYLHSVEYLDNDHDRGGRLDDDILDRDERDDDAHIPLRESRWTVGVRGLRFSWTARDTLIARPKRIEWESTSGLRNEGSVVFSPLGVGDVLDDDGTSSNIATMTTATTATTTTTTSTLMTLCFKFVAPRIVSSLFRRSGKLRKYTEEVLLRNMLTDFRDVVLAETTTERGGRRGGKEWA